jgi:hypothetical protein
MKERKNEKKSILFIRFAVLMKRVNEIIEINFIIIKITIFDEIK